MAEEQDETDSKVPTFEEAMNRAADEQWWATASQRDVRSLYAAARAATAQGDVRGDDLVQRLDGTVQRSYGVSGWDFESGPIPDEIVELHQREKAIPKMADASQAIGSSTVEPARQTPEVAAPIPTADPIPAAPPVTPVAGERDYAPVPLGDGRAGREQKRERRRVAERLLDLPGIPVRERAVDERSVGSAAVTGFAAGFSRGLAAGAGAGAGANATATEPAIQETRAHEAHVAGVAAGEDDALPHLTEAEQADVAERILRGRSPVAGDVHAAGLPGRASTSALSANEQEVLAVLRRPGADRSTQDQVLAALPDRVVHETSVQIAQQDDQAHQVRDANEDGRTRQDEFYARHPELAPDGQQLSSEVLQRHPELRPDPVGPEPHDPDYVRQAGAR